MLRRRTAKRYDQLAQHIIPHFPRSQELEIDELLALQLAAAAAQRAANVAPNPQFLQQYDLPPSDDGARVPPLASHCFLCRDGTHRFVSSSDAASTTFMQPHSPQVLHNGQREESPQDENLPPVPPSFGTPAIYTPWHHWFSVACLPVTEQAGTFENPSIRNPSAAQRRERGLSVRPRAPSLRATLWCSCCAEPSSAEWLCRMPLRLRAAKGPLPK